MPPVVYIDQWALTALLDDLGGDVQIVRRFMQDFLDLWESRAITLVHAISHQLFEVADVVLLSIHSSSRMLGAAPLEAAAVGLLAMVRRADLQSCRALLADLVELGRETCLALDVMLRIGPESASHPASSTRVIRVPDGPWSH